MSAEQTVIAKGQLFWVRTFALRMVAVILWPVGLLADALLAQEQAKGLGC